MKKTFSWFLILLFLSISPSSWAKDFDLHPLKNQGQLQIKLDLEDCQFESQKAYPKPKPQTDKTAETKKELRSKNDRVSLYALGFAYQIEDYRKGQLTKADRKTRTNRLLFQKKCLESRGYFIKERKN